MRKSNERLRHQLEVQSIQIEEFLHQHEVPAEVAGGMVRSRWVSFDINTQFASGLEKLKGLGNELASTLGVSDVSITKYDDRLRVAVKQPDNHPVDLLDLLEAVAEVSPMTATLGLDEEDRPVLLNLLADDVVNILVAGGHEAGKTALLRTFALSLALQNRQSQIQMAIFDIPANTIGRDRKPNLYPLNYLPHVMFTVVENLRDAADGLTFLVEEVEYRIEQEVNFPLLVLMIDDVDKLVEMGGLPIIEPLTYLLEEGVNAGLRIILGASNPNSESIRPVLRNTVPVRLIGRVSDASSARAVSGISDSQAEYLMGKGDFVALSNGMVLPFQAAFITDYDLHLILDKLHRQSQPVMVAQPFDVRQSLNDDEEEPESLQYFEFNSEARQARLNPQNGQEPRRNPSKMIESDTRSIVHHWDDREKLIEDAVWEEVDDADEEEWEEAVEEADPEATIEVWSGFQDYEADDEEDIELDEETNPKELTIWADVKKPTNERAIKRVDPDEIAFDWD